jgi:DNA-binding NarL/FixJ family response regulator
MSPIKIDLLEKDYFVERVGLNRIHLIIPMAVNIEVNKYAALKVEDLTARETEVLYLKAHGLSTKDVAKRLFVSIKTIEAHIKSIKYKFKAETIEELIYLAFKKGVVQPDSSGDPR